MPTPDEHAAILDATCTSWDLYRDYDGGWRARLIWDHGNRRDETVAVGDTLAGTLAAAVNLPRPLRRIPRRPDTPPHTIARHGSIWQIVLGDRHQTRYGRFRTRREAEVEAALHATRRADQARQWDDTYRQITSTGHGVEWLWADEP